MKCLNIECCFCNICAFIGLTSLVQLCLGVYFSFIDNDIAAVNSFIQTEANKVDSYMVSTIYLFIGLGFISSVLAFVSIYGNSKQKRSLSLFVAVMWVLVAAINLVIFGILVIYYYSYFSQSHILLNVSGDETQTRKMGGNGMLLLDRICCGLQSRDQYKLFSPNLLASSCCFGSNDSNATDRISINCSANVTSMVHTSECISLINTYTTLEIWIIGCITSLCAILQTLIIMLMCTLRQRYQKFEENPKYTISRLGGDASFDDNLNNSNDNVQGSSKTIDEIIEVTPI